MSKLSNTQAIILSEAAIAPTTCVTTFMKDIKNPMIKQKSLDSMLTKGLINKRFNDLGTEVYLISEAGFAAIGNTVQRDATPSNTDAAPSSEAKRETKQSIIIDQLSREEGTTLAQLIEATGWKPHSVRGHLSNLRKKRGLPIETFTTSEGTRGYRITQDQEAA